MIIIKYLIDFQQYYNISDIIFFNESPEWLKCSKDFFFSVDDIFNLSNSSIKFPSSTGEVLSELSECMLCMFVFFDILIFSFNLFTLDTIFDKELVCPAVWWWWWVWGGDEGDMGLTPYCCRYSQESERPVPYFTKQSVLLSRSKNIANVLMPMHISIVVKFLEYLNWVQWRWCVHWRSKFEKPVTFSVDRTVFWIFRFSARRIFNRNKFFPLQAT